MEPQYPDYDRGNFPANIPRRGETPPEVYSLEVPSRVNLEKWGVKFDGTTKSLNVQEFIFRVRNMKQDFRCSDEELVPKFHQLLDKPALDWYWNQRRLTNFRTFEEIAAALVAQYQRYGDEFQLQTQILSRKQYAHESFEDYFNTILSLRNQQRTPYSERDLIAIVKGNLKPALAQLIFAVKMRDLGELVREVKRAESLVNYQNHQYPPKPKFVPRVHEIEMDYPEQYESNPEVDAITWQCWNCKETGHGWMFCRQPRRLFCYRCGHDNVTSPDCPRCQGNGLRNPPQPGEARAIQN